MFGVFRTADRLAAMDQAVAQSFVKVRQDTDALNQWVRYLYAQNKELGEQNEKLSRLAAEQKLALSELKVTIAHMPRSAAEIKQLIDAHYSLEPVLQRIRHIEQKIDQVELRRHSAALQSQETPGPSINNQSALREKVMRTLARNSKEYIKKLVLGLVHKYTKVGALQLREIVVEEQGLCSKSSFYRILEEMESEHALQVVSDGKHTIYVAAQHMTGQER